MVDGEVATYFNDIKLKKAYKYIIFQIKPPGNDIISVLKTAPPSASYDDFLAELPKDDGRYAVVDIAYEEEGGSRNKLVFVVWCPDTAKVKQKMLYASSKDALRKGLVGVGTEIQATDAEEIQFDSVLQKLQH